MKWHASKLKYCTHTETHTHTLRTDLHMTPRLPVFVTIYVTTHFLPFTICSSRGNVRGTRGKTGLTVWEDDVKAETLEMRKWKGRDVQRDRNACSAPLVWKGESAIKCKKVITWLSASSRVVELELITVENVLDSLSLAVTQLELTVFTNYMYRHTVQQQRARAKLSRRRREVEML